MDLPFTVEQFFELMKSYNISVWPMQIILNLLALAAVLLSFIKTKNSDKYISSILAFLWIWVGLVYHLLFFTKINSAAYLFGVLFIIQGILFIVYGFMTHINISIKFKPDLYGIIGVLFILYALIIYPIIGYWFGHTYPSNPTFGLPCPTTIFTFGVLLWSAGKIKFYLLIIPFLWSLIGFSAAVNIGVTEDFGLVVAGIIGLILILSKNKKFKS